MLSLTGYRLAVWVGAADMRMGFNKLSGLICNDIKEDPFKGGTIYAFFNQRRNQVKLLVYEGDGFSLYHKQLSRGTFGTPVYDPSARMMVLEKKELLMILEGVEIRYRKRYNHQVRREAGAN